MGTLVVVVQYPSLTLMTLTFPTKATYMQYRSLLLGQEDSHFTFASSSGTGHNTEDFFVINVARSRYKEQLDLVTGHLN